MDINKNKNVTFFKTPAYFRKWLEKYYSEEKELWVGFYKKDSGKPSITWQESVREALCFGWIDGIRKSLDDISYTIRFTPRKPGSTWSTINLKNVEELQKQGLMKPAGLKAFEFRKENKSGIYSYEQRKADLEEPFKSMLKKNTKAYKFFEEQPASYRKAANWWVLSAKKEETRLRRLNILIELSAEEKLIPQFKRIDKS